MPQEISFHLKLETCILQCGTFESGGKHMLSINAQCKSSVLKTMSVCLFFIKLYFIHSIKIVDSKVLA